MTTAPTIARAQTQASERPERVESQILDLRERIGAALPAHIPAERFIRAALSAMRNPQLAEVAQTAEGRKSILEACLRAATDGLLIDGREAALVVRSVKIKSGDQDHWQKLANYQPMVAGILKKARNSGEISAIFCQIVYAHDEFVLDYVTNGPPICHRPHLADRGAPIAVYALALLRDGSWTQPELMTRAEVNEVRDNFARDHEKSLMWQKSWGEAARKTVLRRAAKYWPSSTDKSGRDLGELIREGEGPLDLPAPEARSQLGASASPARALPSPKRPGQAARLVQALAQPQAPAESSNGADPETGEIREPAAEPDPEV